MVSCLWLLGLIVLGVDCLYSLCGFGFAISRYDFAYYVVLIGWVGFGGLVGCCLLFFVFGVGVFWLFVLVVV